MLQSRRVGNDQVSILSPTIEQALQEFVQAEGIGHAQIIHALRIAVTGKTVGFGLFESLAILGKEECRGRIERALALAMA